MNLKIAICDDNKSFLAILHRQIQEYFADKDPNTYNVQYDLFTQGQAVMQLPEASLLTYDLFFIDYQLQDVTGFDIAHYIRQISSFSEIIFVTAFDEYVYAAYEFQAAAYLVKPVDKSKLYTNLNRILTRRLDTQKCFLLRSRDYTVPLPFYKILYFESISSGHSIAVHLVAAAASQEQPLIQSGKIDELAEDLPHFFQRCHKSFVINLAHVQSLSHSRDKYILQLINDEIIPVSRKYRKELQTALLQYHR